VSRINGNCRVDCARCCHSILAMYVRANSSILMFALTLACRTNPVRMPGFIVRLCSLACPTGLHGQVNPLASSETTVLKTRFGPGDAGDALSSSIALDRTWTEQSCHVGKGSTDRSNRLHNTAICPRHSESKRRQSARGDHKSQAPRDVGARKRWLGCKACLGDRTGAHVP